MNFESLADVVISSIMGVTVIGPGAQEVWSQFESNQQQQYTTVCTAKSHAIERASELSRDQFVQACIKKQMRSKAAA